VSEQQIPDVEPMKDVCVVMCWGQISQDFIVLSSWTVFEMISRNHCSEGAYLYLFFGEDGVVIG